MGRGKGGRGVGLRAMMATVDKSQAKNEDDSGLLHYSPGGVEKGGVSTCASRELTEATTKYPIKSQ